MDTVEKKKIRIVSRGIVHTTRGQVITPTGIFYEKTDQILKMLLKDKAKIIELLEDGTTVQLTDKNYNTDNTKGTWEEEALAPKSVPLAPLEEAKSVPTPALQKKPEATGLQPPPGLSKNQRKKWYQQQKKLQQQAEQSNQPEADTQTGFVPVTTNEPENEAVAIDTSLETTELPDSAVEM